MDTILHWNKNIYVFSRIFGSMNRRHVLCGLVGGIPLFAGCSALTGGDGSDGGNESTGTTHGGGEATTAATTAAETAIETTQAATATPTPAATATSTPTATETPMATAAPTTATTPAQTTAGSPATEQATTAGGPTSGEVVIDPSQLETYSSESYPYSIGYPAGWTVDASNPTDVRIEPSTGFALEQIIATEGVSGVTVDTFVSRLVEVFKQQFNTYRVTNRQNVTLPNGNPGVVLDVTIADPAFPGVTIRGKYLFAVVDGTAYIVQLLVANNSYTPEVEQGLTAILNSFTVQSA